MFQLKTSKCQKIYFQLLSALKSYYKLLFNEQIWHLEVLGLKHLRIPKTKIPIKLKT